MPKTIIFLKVQYNPDPNLISVQCSLAPVWHCYEWAYSKSKSLQKTISRNRAGRILILLLKEALQNQQLNTDL